MGRTGRGRCPAERSPEIRPGLGPQARLLSAPCRQELGEQRLTTVRALALALALIGLCTIVVAVVSRTPEAIRLDRPPPSASDPSLGDTFTAREIARNGRFRAPTYLAFAFSALIEISVLALLAVGPWRPLITSVRRLPGGWPLHAIVAAVAVTIVLTVAMLPLGAVTGFFMGRAWGLSTQSFLGWLSDQAKALLVAAVIAAVVAVAFFGVVRWQPRLWWLFGWAALSLIVILVTYAYPVVISPLFNKFTPLQDRALKQRITQLADEAGIHLQDVLVADASRRTTAENAYVAGFGSSKRLVVYDTLLASEREDAILFVVAHELGHQRSNDVLKGTLLAIAGLFVGFALLAWFGSRGWLWRWAGATWPGDLRAMPVLVLFAVVANLLALPVTNTISRHLEANADATALHLTHDPAGGVRLFRQLAFTNLSDLDPNPVAVAVLFTHPATRQRIDALLRHQ